MTTAATELSMRRTTRSGEIISMGMLQLSQLAAGIPPTRALSMRMTIVFGRAGLPVLLEVGQAVLGCFPSRRNRGDVPLGEHCGQRFELVVAVQSKPKNLIAYSTAITDSWRVFCDSSLRRYRWLKNFGTTSFYTPWSYSLSLQLSGFSWLCCYPRFRLHAKRRGRANAKTNYVRSHWR